MNLKTLFFLALIIAILISCNNKKTSESSKDSDTTSSIPVTAGSTEKVIYKRATFYAGAVDFYFDDPSGKEVSVRVSHAPEDSGAVYPQILLESGDSLEGPPGANPAVVGKPFLLIKNAKGEVREIKAAN